MSIFCSSEFSSGCNGYSLQLPVTHSCLQAQSHYRCNDWNSMMPFSMAGLAPVFRNPMAYNKFYTLSVVAILLNPVFSSKGLLPELHNWVAQRSPPSTTPSLTNSSVLNYKETYLFTLTFLSVYSNISKILVRMAHNLMSIFSVAHCVFTRLALP